MTPEDRRQAAKAIMNVRHSLSALLNELEGTPINPSVFLIDLVVGSAAIDAAVRSDPRNKARAIIDITPGIAFALRRAFDEFVRLGFEDAQDNAARSDSLVEMALQWVLLHEVSHWTLGHLGYIAKAKGVPLSEVRLSAATHTIEPVTGNEGTWGNTVRPDAPAEDYHCMELQADFAATQLLDILHWQDASDDEADVAQRSGDRGRSVPESRLRVAVAAGAVILLIERERQLARRPECDALHPSPEARALNVMAVLMGRSVIDLGEFRDGDIYVPLRNEATGVELRRIWADALRDFYRFLTPLAEQIGVPPLFSKSELASAGEGGDQVPVTARDLIYFVIEPDAGPERFVTEGCKELARLRQRHLKLKGELAPFSAVPI